MLEPYQPKFIDVPRASLAVPLVGVTGTVPINVNGTPMMTSHHQQQARPSYPLIEYATINGAPSAVHQVVISFSFYYFCSLSPYLFIY